MTTFGNIPEQRTARRSSRLPELRLCSGASLASSEAASPPHPLPPLGRSTNPMSERRSANWRRISAICSSVCVERKCRHAKSRPRANPPSRTARAHPSYALRSATWSERAPPASRRLHSSACAFLSIGSTNGSRYASPAATVSAGERHPIKAAVTSIFPTRGSTGSVARCRPSAVSRSSAASSAPIVVSRSIAFRTARGSGGWSALDRKPSMEPSSSDLIWRASSSSGVRSSSGRSCSTIAACCASV
mmetsp:Transcript_13388/g.44099  ORF Transcript_13388/g.44099 Transcript_13388/m.44099 type:complete len:247 (+) Transcript_13388:147-887(+)